MTDPWQFLALAFFILWAYDSVRLLLAEGRAAAERESLLDRIQAQVPGVLERVDAHEARQQILNASAVSEQREEDEPDFLPPPDTEPTISPAEGMGIVKGVVG